MTDTERHLLLTRARIELIQARQRARTDEDRRFLDLLQTLWPWALKRIEYERKYLNATP